jgi:hypothetical protein
VLAAGRVTEAGFAVPPTLQLEKTNWVLKSNGWTGEENSNVWVEFGVQVES